MTSDQESIRQLLRPTHDSAGWHAAVAALDRDQALPVLLAILRNPGEAEFDRSSAANLLAALGDTRAAPALIQELHGGDQPLVRATSALALGQLGTATPEAVSALASALRDPNDFVRESGARVLGMLKPEGVLEALEVMRSEDAVSSNRDFAAQAIEQIRGEG